MSYVQCPDCGKKIEIFGESKAAAMAEQIGCKNVARVPFDGALTKCADNGLVELFEGEYLDELFRVIE